MKLACEKKSNHGKSSVCVTDVGINRYKTGTSYHDFTSGISPVKRTNEANNETVSMRTGT